MIQQCKQRGMADAVPKLQTKARPISSLPKFLHVLLGVSRWPLGYEERRCWANCLHN